jgi:hypothetical protein
MSKTPNTPRGEHDFLKLFEGQIFDPAVVAKNLGIHKNAVYLAIQAGRLSATPLGAPGSRRPVYRIRRNAISDWLYDQEETIGQNIPVMAP